MLDYLGLDLGRADPVARGLDNVVGAALEIDVTLIVHVAIVAGDAPSVDEFLRHRVWILPVLLHHYRVVGADRDFAGLAGFDRRAGVRIDHRDLVAGIGLAERFEAGLLHSPAIADEVVGLGLAEGLVELDLELLVDPARELRADRLGGAPDASQSELAVLLPRILDLAQRLERG